MINLPEGFDAVTLVNELFQASLPIIQIGFVVCCGSLVIAVLNGRR